MVKVTSSILVGAALFASSSTLAAPTRFKRSSAEVAASTDLLDANDESDLVDEATGALGLDQQTGSVGPMIADTLARRDGKRTGSDAIRRGLPLTPESASDLAKRESVVAKLGLTGALAPLGVGPLIPTVQGLVDGLPVVGGPVGGLVKTVDTTVGLTDLLNKPKAKRDLLSGLMGSTTDSASGALGGLSGLTGGLTSGLPLGGALDTGSSTINGLLGQLQGAGASSSQLAGVLGQLQGLGLGNLPLSALTGSATPSSSSSSSSTGSTQQNQAASTPSSATVQQATSILQGLTVAQAEQYGLLPSGTTGKVLTQIESAAAAQASANNLASSFTSRTYGFKAQGGHNETSTDMEEDQGGATPTFAIASPDAVASAIMGGGSASNSTMEPSSTSAAEMSKRTMMPSSASSSMTPMATSTGASSAKKPSATSSDSMDDSGSDYSDEEDEDDEDSDMESDTEEPVTPTSSTAPLARRGGPLEDDGEPESDMSKKKDKETHGGMEGQGPHASGAWHATDSSSMAHTQSQAVATAEAMTYTYSDASATAVPTTAPSKRSYADLD